MVKILCVWYVEINQVASTMDNIPVKVKALIKLFQFAIFSNFFKISLSLSSISNLVQLLVSIFSLFTKIFCRFSRIIIEKTTFEEFEEICE